MTFRFPMNFGGIDDARYSNIGSSRVVVLPIALKTPFCGSAAILEASRNLGLYDDETDTEVFKLGIHTLAKSVASEDPESIVKSLYETSKVLLKNDKFLCVICTEPVVSFPVICAHAERFHNLSILRIGAHPDLDDSDDKNVHTVGRIVKDLHLPVVEVGIRTISANEALVLAEGLPVKIFWAKEIVGHTEWISDVLKKLTDNVHLSIDVGGLDPSIMPDVKQPEPGGIGWYDTLTLIRRIAEKRRIVGLDLVGFYKNDNSVGSAFLCAKLIYKSLAYIFRNEAPKVVGGA